MSGWTAQSPVFFFLLRIFYFQFKSCNYYLQKYLISVNIENKEVKDALDVIGGIIPAYSAMNIHFALFLDIIRLKKNVVYIVKILI